jgi:hypothetical protein
LVVAVLPLTGDFLGDSPYQPHFASFRERKMRIQQPESG